jgi:hypothetical protein
MARTGLFRNSAVIDIVKYYYFYFIRTADEQNKNLIASMLTILRQGIEKKRNM